MADPDAVHTRPSRRIKRKTLLDICTHVFELDEIIRELSTVVMDTDDIQVDDGARMSLFDKTVRDLSHSIVGIKRKLEQL